MPIGERASADTVARPLWGRALLWLAFLGPFFFATYAFANWLASRHAEVGAVVFEWEKAIPFVAWTIVPYWSIDLCYGLSLLLPRTRHELDAHAKRLLTAQLVSVACFIAFPLKFTFERPTTSGFFGWLFDVLLGFDKPFNQAPSLHISLLVILWSLGLRHVHGRWRIVMHAWALLIALSVLTTFQHHFIDIPTGFLAGALAVLAFPLDPPERLRQRDAMRWRIGARYLVGAALCALVGAYAGGWGLWLLWPAAALALVAALYAQGEAWRFGKRDGRMDPFAQWLLAPYIGAAWLNSRWWTRRHPEPSEVVPGVRLSRLASAAELARHRPQALVDLCAELPLSAGRIPVYAVPMLDLLAPEPEQIERGVAALTAARAHGDTLVFCALGYSRSASIVAAWLVADGRAASIDEAAAIIARARPGIVLSPRHLGQLRNWHERRARG